MNKVIKLPNPFGREAKLKVIAYYRTKCNDKEFLKIIQDRLDAFFNLPFLQKHALPLDTSNLSETEINKIRIYIDEITTSFGIMCQDVLDLELKLYLTKKNGVK